MPSIVGSGAEYRKVEYLKEVGAVLGNKRRHASFEIYARGLMGDGERKSAEPIAARACANPSLVDAYHQRLTYFLSESDWSDDPLRRFAARYALEEMTKRERVSTWIIDETGFPKQGTHSVGVKRQFNGTVGKVANCQVGVSLSVGTGSQHLPIDFELYLPHCWSDDPVRRSKAHIPSEVGYRTRSELALQMIRRAIANKVPLGVILADPAYGDSSAFRQELREHGLDYAAGVYPPTTVWGVDESGERQGQPMSVEEMSHAMEAQFCKVSWWEKGKGELWSRFASCRVRPVGCVAGGADDEELWLLMEMPPGEMETGRYWLVTLPRDATREQLVQLVKERYRTLCVHEALKNELGLDHFEGRTYRGWHHHVTVALVCFAFIVAERVRRASPRRQPDGDDLWIAGTPRTPSPPDLEQPRTVLLPPQWDMPLGRSDAPKAQCHETSRHEHALHSPNST